MNTIQVAQMIAEVLGDSLGIEPYETEDGEIAVSLMEYGVDGGTISLRLGLWYYDRNETREDGEPDEVLEASAVVSLGRSER